MNLITYQKLPTIFSLSFFNYRGKVKYFISETFTAFIYKFKFNIGLATA